MKKRILPSSIPLLHKDIETEYKEETIQSQSHNLYECSICYESHDSIMITNCNHMHCRKCLHNWTQIKRECPICRTTVKKCVYQYQYQYIQKEN